MECKACGAPISEGARFCTHCGQTVVEDAFDEETIEIPHDLDDGYVFDMDDSRGSGFDASAGQADPFEPSGCFDTESSGSAANVLNWDSPSSADGDSSFSEGNQATEEIPVETFFPQNSGYSGSQVQGNSAAPASAPVQPSKKPAKPLLLAVIAVIVVAAIAGVAIGGGSANDKSSSTSTSSSVTAGKETQKKNAGGSTEKKASPSKAETVTLTVKTQSGETLSGTVIRQSNGYVIADTDTHEYSVADFKSMHLSDAELCVAWNEPYARAGYHFNNSGLQKYFESCSWYVDRGKSVTISAIAEANANKLHDIADENSSSARWRYLAKN